MKRPLQLSGAFDQGLIVAAFSNPTDHIVRYDLDPEFIETALTRLAWNYVALFEQISNNFRLNQWQKQEYYNRNRSTCAIEALQFACARHNVPYSNVRLSCNGQIKMLVRMGRVIIMQEAIDAYGEPPKVADYKLKLASANSAVAQLELDLGDGWFRNSEWSGCILSVLLHKQAGPDFSEAHKKLGGVSLGIPDAGYSHWTRRYDLHEIAMHGRRGASWLTDAAPLTEDSEQVDEVIIGVKKKNTRRETEK